MHPAVDAGSARIEPDIDPNLHSALFDLAEILRKFQKGRYFYFKFSKCFQLFFQPDIQGSGSLRYPASLILRLAYQKRKLYMSEAR